MSSHQFSRVDHNLWVDLTGADQQQRKAWICLLHQTPLKYRYDKLLKELPDLDLKENRMETFLEEKGIDAVDLI